MYTSAKPQTPIAILRYKSIILIETDFFIQQLMAVDKVKTVANKTYKS